ncbi:hypothetical protein G6F63_014725 [Rhizopus arrhizus]|nr:hypothetical protein G6F63_014725 [Rhizopus arrhizus]
MAERTTMPTRRHAAHQQAVEGVVRVEHAEGREVQELRHAVVHGEVAVAQLDQLGHDERQAERHQQFLRVAELVDAAQEEAFDAHAQHARDDRGQHQRGPEPRDRRERVGGICADHVERGVREVQHAHHSENQGQACRHHE